MSRAVALSTALLAVCATSAQAYSTPGYDGIRKAPKTKPIAGVTASAVMLPAGGGPAGVVDDAGTTHVVLTPPTGAPETVVYCRIKRGGTACDNPNQTLPAVPQTRPSATTSAFALDWVRPYILGGSLLVVATAHGSGPLRANGVSMPSHVWLWESRDGGQSFDAPVLVGDARTLPLAAFGTPDAPRFLGGRTDDTGGLFATVFTTAAIGVGEVELLRDGRAFADLAATTQDGLPVLAYATATGARVLTPSSADRVTDPSGYVAASLPGTRISIAGGPAGLLAVTSVPRGSTADVTVRRVRGATAGGPQPLGEGLTPQIAQHSSGSVTAVAVRRAANGVPRLAVASGRRGTLGQPLDVQLPGAVKSTTPQLRGLSIGPDGGGFAIASGSAQVNYAIGVGQTAPTGTPGLGGLPGGGAPASGVQVSCGTVTIGKLELRALVGCLLPAADGSGRRLSEEPIRVGGMDVIPEAGVKIIIDPRRRTLDTTGTVTVRLRGGDLDVPIYRGELHITIPRGAPGELLASFPAERTVRPTIGGFPLRGDADVTITATGVRIPVALELPAAMSGIRGEAVLETGDDGLRLSSVVIAADLVPLPGGEIRDLRIAYENAGSWSGQMRLVLHGGLELGFAVEFRAGRFIQGRIGVSKWPGLPIAKAVFLNRVAGDLRLEPGIVLGLEARVGAVPAYPQTGYVAGIDGRLQVSIPRQGPFEISLSGTGDILGITLASASTVLRSDGYFRQRGNLGLDAGVASLSADVDLSVDGGRGLFNAEFGIAACVYLVLGDACGRGAAIVSNIGFAACAEIDVEIFTGSAYFGYEFPKRPPYDFGRMAAGVGDGCNDDLSAFRLPGTSEAQIRDRKGTKKAQAAQAVDEGISIPGGRRIANIELSASIGAPEVSAAVAPDGTRIPLDGSDKRAVGVPMPRGNRTIVLLRKPAAGSWRVATTPGTPTVIGTRVAVALPARKPITGQVVRRGASRQLRYRVSPRAGERIVFVERTRSGFERRLGVAGTNRRIVIARDELGAGRRSVYAVREIGGLSRSRELVAAYDAPGARTPGSVGRLRVDRGRRTVTVRFAASADATLVTFRMSDGRRFAKTVRAGGRAITVRGLLPQDRGSVTAVHTSPSGRTGPATRRTIRADSRRTR